MSFSSVSGQDWAPIGATWNYSAFNFGTPVVDVSSITSVGDTVINGRSCKVLSYYYPYLCSWVSTAFLHSDSNRVYFYNQSVAQFNLLYDFNAGQGDSWELANTKDTTIFTIYVDSIDSITINGIILKVMYIRSLDPMADFSGMAIERIGLVTYNYLFPQIGVCDPQVSGLRCYKDSIIGLYETGLAPTCDSAYISSGKNSLIKQSHIKLFPNPFEEELTISLLEPYGEKAMVTIIDLLGHQVMQKMYYPDTSRQILVSDLGHLPGGLYFLNIKSSKFHSTSKLVK